MIVVYCAYQQWLRRKLDMVDDILSEAPLYKHLVAQGKEEGLKEGEKKGMQQGMAQGSVTTSRKAILALFHERFPQLNVFAQKTVPTLKRPDILEQLIIQIALAKDEDEAQKHLVAALQQDI